MGCASSRAPEPTTPAPAPGAVPQLPAGTRSAPAHPTRVDHAHGPLNASFADLGSTDVAPAPRGSARLASAYAIGFSAPVRNPSYAVALAPTCRTSADCGGGDLSCRAREDGVRVCMGLGSAGESCWFGGDCVSGSCALAGDRRTCR